VLFRSEAAKEQGFDVENDWSEEDTEAAALDWLCDRTYVITFPEGIIIRSF
jgi:hypothetical protein